MVALLVVFVASSFPPGVAHAAGGVTVSVGSSSLVEGDSGARSLHIPVTLDAPATTTVSVNYAVEAGNATPGSLGTSAHFRPRTGVLYWRPNAKTGLTTTERIVAVPIVPNTVVDGDETFAVVLSNPTGGAVIHQAVGSGTIRDDDPEVGLPRVSVGDVAVYAGVAGNDRTADVPVTLSRPVATNITVNYSIGGGTATGRFDYVAKASGTLTFKAGKTLSKYLVLRIPPHVVPEPNKTASVTLAAVSSGAVLGRTIGTVTIDDEAYQGNLAGPKVAAIGDSIVFVSSGSITSALADRYAYWVIGIPGYTIGNALPSLDQELATTPDDVISNLGTDDALEDNAGWQTNFEALMTRLENVPCVELVTVDDTDADYFGSLTHGDAPDAIGTEINQALADAVAAHTNLHLIDWKSAVDADPTLLADGIHPSTSGQQWLAAHYRSAIDQDC